MSAAPCSRREERQKAGACNAGATSARCGCSVTAGNVGAHPICRRQLDGKEIRNTLLVGLQRTV